jgi:fermentation-respiration switch protein FrsA (DUF1100 family)
MMLAHVAGAAGDDLKPGANRVEFGSGGEKLVGTLFLPAAYRPGVKAPAVVVAGPWTTVKEQTGGVYAAALAERGVAALVFDFRFFGESGGRPRQFESPRHKLEDLRAAVAYLKTLPGVDPDRIGLLGICFGAGYAVAAAAEDPDVKSVATVAAWVHDAASLKAVFGEEEIARRYKVGASALKAFEADKTVSTVPAHSTADKTAAMFNVDFYADPKRGAVPQWKNEFAVMSWPGWLDFDALALAPKVKVPLLVVHSDGSALPDNARRLLKAASGPKDLYWTEGNHTDFYDGPAHVAKAADAVAAHFRRTLAGGPQK